MSDEPKGSTRLPALETKNVLSQLSTFIELPSPPGKYCPSVLLNMGKVMRDILV